MRTNDEIIQIISDEKAKLSLSTSELARRVGMAKSAVSRYLNKTREFPLNRADDFSKVLKITPEYLLGFSSDEISKMDTSTFSSPIEKIYKKLNEPNKKEVYDFASSLLITQENDSNKLKSVPLVGSAAANPVELSYGDTVYDESVEINVPGTADCALVVQGDSMEPEFMNGSIVFYKLQKIVESGELAIVEVDGNGVTFKRVCFDHDNQKVVLKSLNDKYDDRTLNPEQVRIIGKVVQ